MLSVVEKDLERLGEFGFIAELKKRFPAGEGVAVGLGDDAAVVDISGHKVLFTTDMLVEGVHFDGAFTPGDCVGYKAVACNVSDIAAMGGRPLFAVASIGVAPGIDAFEVVEGMREAAEGFALDIVGGDTTTAPAFTVSMAMIGEAPAGPVLRSTARSGDMLCVTGACGAAAAGLELLRRREQPEAASLLKRFPGLRDAYVRGRARVREGAIAAVNGATAMIDVSDGAGADANHLAEESDLGVLLAIENVPRASGVAEAGRLVGIDPYRLAASGGEDYELLMSVHPHDVDMLRDAIAPTPLTVVGEFSKRKGREALWPDGKRTPLSELGWDHFA